MNAHQRRIARRKIKHQANLVLIAKLQAEGKGPAEIQAVLALSNSSQEPTQELTTESQSIE